VEAEAEFGIDLAGVVEVEAAEGEGVVQQDAAVATLVAVMEVEMRSVMDLQRARSKVVLYGRYWLG